MKGYDEWLEAPYVEAAKLEAEYERFCEQENLDPDLESTKARFEDWLEGYGEVE